MAAAFYVHRTISNKIEQITEISHYLDQDQYKLEHVFQGFAQTKKDFQHEPLNAGDTSGISAEIKLIKSFIQITTQVGVSKHPIDAESKQLLFIQRYHDKTLRLSGRLLILKNEFDSLLNDDRLNILRSQKRSSSKAAINIGIAAPKFIAIANTTHKPNITIPLLSKKFRLVPQKTPDTTTYIKRNLHFILDVESVITSCRNGTHEAEAELKDLTFKNFQEVGLLLRRFYLLVFFLLSTLTILMFVSGVKLNQSEIRLIEAKELAETSVKQKMDLLLQMSHEIRTSLSSIKGFLYLFSKTGFSTGQAKMMNSIHFSSDMLMQTLNNTLDAAKMANSAFKIHHDTFNPYSLLKELTASMELGATKKKLNIYYYFEGNKKTMVSGDSFRLKQIVVNLLSNAIKYTDVGGIIVNAYLNHKNVLQVDIIDTGSGISAEQQVKLFSKYYQTNSINGKTGTGLGLYICKQLVLLQNGQISVKSSAGMGSTFSFYIPYSNDTDVAKKNDYQIPSHQLSVLHDIKILAINVGKLNVTYLHSMMNKSNIQFYHTSKLREALEILSKKEISVILTCKRQPGINNNKLLTIIKRLNSQREIPVVFIEPDHMVTYVEEPLKNRFLDPIITKPNFEADLIKQILLILKL